MTINRRDGTVLLVTTSTGETWLTSIDDLRADLERDTGRLRQGRSMPGTDFTVWEVNGSAVVGPLENHYAPGFGNSDVASWTFNYPSGQTAFQFEEEGFPAPQA